MLVALPLLLFLGVVLIIPKGSNSNEDETAFANCNNVKDYREYVSNYGRKGKHYTEAVEFINQYVADSTIKADAEAEKATKKAENDLYRSCNTIEGCNRYLKTYPQGRYAQEIKQKKERMEAEAAWQSEDDL